MLQPIQYNEKQFIIVNDIANSMFYFFDYDQRYSQINMEFEHFHFFYEIHILLSPNAIHFLEGVPYPIESHDFVLLPPSLLHKSCYPEKEPSKRLVISFYILTMTPHLRIPTRSFFPLFIRKFPFTGFRKKS